MSFDRKKLLRAGLNARAAMNNPALPADLRALAKDVWDHAEIALGMDSALARMKGEDQNPPGSASGR